MEKYRFTLTKTMHYYGCPQARYDFNIKGSYLDGRLTWWGNQGFDALVITNNHNGCNGYIWSMHKLMNEIYGDGKEIRKGFGLREGESMEIVL